jgi:hypothetical protein
MPIELTQRTSDVVTGAADLEPLHTFAKFPVFMGTTHSPPEQDLFAPMEWMISRSSGAIQLGRLLPLELLYGASHGSGSVGALWQRHHDEFAAFIAGFSPRRVLEVGGGHGLLAQAYSKRASAEWTVIEPNPTPVPDCPATFIRGFFDESFRLDGNVDAFVHSHVLEHAYDPRAFLSLAAAVLEPGQRMFFSVPNLERMLELGYTNAINFEHTALLSESHIRWMLNEAGFAVETVMLFLDDHSVFYCALRVAEAQRHQPLARGADHGALYRSYVEHHRTLVDRLNSETAGTDSPCYLFGAHVFAQYLFSFGLDESRITAVLDNDRRKQGARLYGSRLMVESPSVLRATSRPKVILKAGVYNDEIRQQLLVINTETLVLE